MANQFVAIPVPAANGSGAAVDVSTFAALKTAVFSFGTANGQREASTEIERELTREISVDHDRRPHRRVFISLDDATLCASTHVQLEPVPSRITPRDTTAELDPRTEQRLFRGLAGRGTRQDEAGCAHDEDVAVRVRP